MTKIYTSFKAIDEHLKILKLQREIKRESIKADLYSVKTHLNPASIIGDLGSNLKQAALLYGIGILGHLFQRRHRSEP
jgi:hypothetical protein